MVIIEESNMRFGEYAPEDVFRIEKCNVYEHYMNPIGFKTCEFVLRRNESLYFVEAKESSPHKIEADVSKEKAEKYHKYIQDIVCKMRDSLALYASILLKRHENESLPQNLAAQDWSCAEINCLLVVKKAKKEWGVDLRDKLNSAVKKERRAWKIKDFYVLNEAQARSKQFIL